MTPYSPISDARAWEIGEALHVDWSRVNLDQFRRGLEVEREHGSLHPDLNVTNDDLAITGKLVLAHLRQFPDYYTRLEAMEEAAEEFWTTHPRV